jgi:hypothetical protein
MERVIGTSIDVPRLAVAISRIRRWGTDVEIVGSTS